MPYEIPALSGKPYRPSNGMEGESFIGVFCQHCKRGEYERTGKNPEQACDILSRSFWNNVGDPEYPTEWVHDKKGRPTCTAFESIGKGADDD